jgi:hypothetical protein
MGGECARRFGSCYRKETIGLHHFAESLVA